MNSKYKDKNGKSWDCIKPEIFHIYPSNNKHTIERTCWCCPYLDYKDELTQNEVWVHREDPD